MASSASKYEIRKKTTGDNVVGLWRPSFTRVDNILYVFGGGGMVTNNLTTFNLETCRWNTVRDVQGIPPSKRYGHSALLYNNTIIIFGGINEFQEYCNDIIIFDIARKSWSRPEVSGRGVPARYFHTATLYDDKMFVYGGFSRNSECTFVIDKLNILDLKDYTWSSPISVPSRYNHSATLIGDRLYIFAGKDEIGNTVSDLISVELASSQLRVSKLNMSGCSVLLKSQHFSEAVGNSLIVFGKLMDDMPASTVFGLWKLDLKHLSWTMLDCKRSFSRGVWNYFTVVPLPSANPQKNGLMISTPQPADKTRLIFLGNEDLERPQPYDHFRDLLRLDAECLGLWRPHQPTLAMDFAKILERHDTFDFTLFSRDLQEVGVHSIILLARWPYFCNIIASGMQERNQQSLHVEGSLEAVRTLVRFIYTDDLDEYTDWEVVGEVLCLASFYILPRLSKLCCELLHRSLRIETCCQIFHFANQAGEQSLQTVAVHFLLENFGEVVNTTDLASLPPHELKTLFSFIPRDAKLSPMDDM